MDKRTFIVNGIATTFSNVIAVINGEELEVLLVHNENDTCSDGDLITLDAFIPENADEAEHICEEIANNNNIAATDRFTAKNGKYIITEW